MAETITVSVDSEIAAAYRAASTIDRRKLDVLINLRLCEATRSGQSLQKVMLEISRNAQQRGLTPAILQDILNEQRPGSSSIPTSLSAPCCSAIRCRGGPSRER